MRRKAEYPTREQATDDLTAAQCLTLSCFAEREPYRGSEIFKASGGYSSDVFLEVAAVKEAARETLLLSRAAHIGSNEPH